VKNNFTTWLAVPDPAAVELHLPLAARIGDGRELVYAVEGHHNLTGSMLITALSGARSIAIR
jgi:hypothetical protein